MIWADNPLTTAVEHELVSSTSAIVKLGGDGGAGACMGVPLATGNATPASDVRAMAGGSAGGDSESAGMADPSLLRK